MVTVPRPPPTQERQREYDRVHGASQALFGGHVGQPTEIEKPLKYSDNKYWDTRVKRWRWKQGMKSTGKSIAGRFTLSPTGRSQSKRHTKKSRRKFK